MTKEKSDYTIKWEEPPVSTRGGSSGQLFAALEQIKTDDEHQGEWARVVQSNSRSGASSILTGIRGGKRRVPDGKFEFTVRTDGEAGTSALYARYLGDE